MQLLMMVALFHYRSEVNSTTEHTFFFFPNLKQTPVPLIRLDTFASTVTNTLYKKLKCSQIISFCQFCYVVKSCSRQEGTKPNKNKKGQTEKTSLTKLAKIPSLNLPDTKPFLPITAPNTITVLL